MKLEDGKSLYEALGVEKTATKAEIRKAYHKLALRLHPDKVQAATPAERDAANERFQTLQRVFSVLSDEEKRKVYDMTGSLEDSEQLTGESFDDLYHFYRDMYKKVTEDDLVEFENSYRGSKEEANDLKDLYTTHCGDMTMVFQYLMCSRPEMDSHRFMKDIQRAVSKGELKQHSRFDTWASKVAKTPAPAAPGPLAVRPSGVKKKKAGGGGGGMDSLALMIQSRQAARGEDLFASLEAKYAGGSSAGGGRGAKKAKGGSGEPSEEDFARARNRMDGRKRLAKKKG